MSRQVLQEYFRLCPDGVCEDLLTESEKKYIREGGMILSGICQRADTKNGNGRIYPKRILEREVQKYQQVIKEHRSLGSLDHPSTDLVELKDSSHIITALWMEGGDVIGKLKVLPTPTGNILKILIQEGVVVGISSRSLGSITETNRGIIVEDDLSLISFDVVSLPSTEGAYLKQESNSPSLRENKKEKINNLLNEILKK